VDRRFGDSAPGGIRNNKFRNILSIKLIFFSYVSLFLFFININLGLSSYFYFVILISRKLLGEILKMTDEFVRVYDWVFSEEIVQSFGS
jgi:hypothetical protein